VNRPIFVVQICGYWNELCVGHVATRMKATSGCNSMFYRLYCCCDIVLVVLLLVALLCQLRFQVLHIVLLLVVLLVIVGFTMFEA